MRERFLVRARLRARRMNGDFEGLFSGSQYDIHIADLGCFYRGIRLSCLQQVATVEPLGKDLTARTAPTCDLFIRVTTRTEPVP